MTEDMWRQVAVSAFLRYETYDPELVASAPAVIRRQSLSVVEEEDALLEAVLWLYQNGIAPQVRMCAPDGRCGCVCSGAVHVAMQRRKSPLVVILGDSQHSNPSARE